MPGALYIVSAMSSISARVASVTSATGAARRRRRGSGYWRICRSMGLRSGPGGRLGFVLTGAAVLRSFRRELDSAEIITREQPARVLPPVPRNPARTYYNARVDGGRPGGGGHGAAQARSAGALHGGARGHPVGHRCALSREPVVLAASVDDQSGYPQSPSDLSRGRHRTALRRWPARALPAAPGEADAGR